MLCLWIVATWIAHSSIVVLGSSCDSLEGKWYNQLGSELILEEGPGGVLTGEMRTAVEIVAGAAGDTHSEVRGISTTFNSETMLGFSAVFSGSPSVSSWIGQCIKCGDQEVLQSTWLLKTMVDSCMAQWKSTLISEDIFIRHDRIHGPRKDLGTHTPKRSSESIPRAENLNVGSFQSNLRGKWYTSDGIQLDLSVDDVNGTIEGTYLTRDADVMPVLGTFDPRYPVGVFGLHGAWEGSKIAQVWVGQYHYCEGGKEVLETSWLRRSPVVSCERDVKATNFGRMTFIRTPPSKSDVGSNWFYSSVFSDVATKISTFFSNLFGN